MTPDQLQQVLRGFPRNVRPQERADRHAAPCQTTPRASEEG